MYEPITLTILCLADPQRCPITGSAALLCSRAILPWKNSWSDFQEYLPDSITRAPHQYRKRTSARNKRWNLLRLTWYTNRKIVQLRGDTHCHMTVCRGWDGLQAETCRSDSLLFWPVWLTAPDSSVDTWPVSTAVYGCSQEPIWEYNLWVFRPRVPHLTDLSGP